MCYMFIISCCSSWTLIISHHELVLSYCVAQHKLELQYCMSSLIYSISPLTVYCCGLNVPPPVIIIISCYINLRPIWTAWQKRHNNNINVPFISLIKDNLKLDGVFLVDIFLQKLIFFNSSLVLICKMNVMCFVWLLLRLEFLL